MYCPQCGQERISHETSFCSRCGFLLTGTADLLHTGGLIPTAGSKPSGVSSPKSRGLKQGLFIFLLTFLVVPIVAIISVALQLPPWAIVISSITLFVGGLLRMAYALMFESAVPGVPTLEENMMKNMLGRPPAHEKALPPQQSIPVSSYGPPVAGKWRDTNDLQPSSVTDSTTKLLEKDQ
jgi:hypothetical protein